MERIFELFYLHNNIEDSYLCTYNRKDKIKVGKMYSYSNWYYKICMNYRMGCIKKYYRSIRLDKMKHM